MATKYDFNVIGEKLSHLADNFNILWIQKYEQYFTFLFFRPKEPERLELQGNMVLDMVPP